MRKMMVSAGACLLLVSTGCLSAYNQEQVALQQDIEACSRYGSEYRSPVYAECMTLRNQRRDIATARQNEVTAHSNEVIANRLY